MKRLTLIYLGQTGAGPVYSLEMAKAVYSLGTCQLQIVISKRTSNLDDWINQFQGTDVQLDVVDTYKHNQIDFALSMFKFWRIRRIVKLIRDFKPDCLYVPFLLSWDFLIYPRLYKRMRIIATLHDPHPHDVLKNPLVKWLHHQNEKAYRYVSDVVILNNKDIAFVRDNYCPNVYVIPHASFSSYVNVVDADARLKNTIGFLGRIEPYKGLDLLVDAFQKLGDHYKLLIAGSGKVDDVIRKKMASDSRIELINRYIDDEEFSGLLNRMDFVVLTYKRASQSGVIPLVFAHGKPVIVTNVGALIEQVPEGTGIVTNADVESIAKSISSFYENPNIIVEYGKNAKHYADSELSWNHSAELLMKIVDKN